MKSSNNVSSKEKMQQLNNNRQIMYTHIQWLNHSLKNKRVIRNRLNQKSKCKKRHK